MTAELAQYYMAMALRLAEKGVYTTHPNPRVGCVLVKDGTVVGTGFHEKAGLAHAEINALNQAGTKARGAVAYVTLEPCCHHGKTGPCTEALIQAGVSQVVAAMLDPNPLVAGKGLAQLTDAGVSTQYGVLEQQALALNPGFVQRMRTGRPWVYCKLAVSLDGHTAMASGESQWISCEASRQDVHHWRARSSAIMTGVGTILSDDPSLTARLPRVNEQMQPMRVILDSQLRMPTNAKCLGLPGKTLVFTLSTDAQKYNELTRAGAEVVVLPAGPDTTPTRVDLHQVMHYLGDMQVNEVWVEAGATLNGALLEAGLMDQCILYMAPHFMGSQTLPMLKTSGIHSMQERIELEVLEVRAIGNDWRMKLKPKIKTKTQ